MSSRRRIWPWLLLGLAVLLTAAGWWLLRYRLRPDRTAHRHVPAGAMVVLRADGVQLATFKPVRDHLWPVIIKARLSGGRDPGDRVERIAKATGVRLPGDLREVVLASVDGLAWVALLGGAIERGRFVAGLEQVLKEEGATGWSRDGDILVHSFGPAVGQADDGTLVAGTSAALVRAALPAREADDEAELPLPIDGALTFLLTRTATSKAIGAIPLTVPGLDALSKIDRATGTVTLSDAPQIELVLVPREGVAPSELAGALDGMLLKVRLLMLAVPHDLWGGKQALGDASVKAEGALVRVSAPWPYEPLDQAVANLAELVRAGGKAAAEP